MKKTASENSGKGPSKPTSADSTASAKPRKQKKRVSSSGKTSQQDGGAQLSEKKSSMSTELEPLSNSTPKKLKTLRRLAEKELFETENFLEGVLAAISIGATVRSAAASHEIRYSALQARLNQADMRDRYRQAQQASADALAEKSQELAERMIPADGEEINPHTAKVVLEHLRWLSKVKDPARYGDTQNVNMNTRDLTKEHLEELRKINTKVIEH